MKHVLVLADGSAGEVGSRLAAQTASASAMARIRSSVLPDMESTLYEAFGEAHQATRRVLLGTGLEDKAGASLLVVVVGADGLVVGRVGGGRVYLLRGDRLDPMFSSTSAEVVGVGDHEPEIV
ncbi:MAG TPA: protein phosphatase 2C domain-containing protein, partial [Myxococcota bacterium]|nr:protein phosphatase 2C domain-containing protein [Myxococcota bacterium]